MHTLPTGIVPIVQTPFLASHAIDVRSFELLIEDAVAAGAAGIVYPAVASEVSSLSIGERQDLLRRTIASTPNRVPVIAGVSSDRHDESRRLAVHAAKWGANGILIQPTQSAQSSPDSLITYLHQLTAGIDLPIILQDLDWNGPGLAIESILQVADEVSNLKGIKVETTPAGPKYSAIRDASSRSLHVSGGWAVTQMIDGLTRGVDAFMPEASMVRIYRTIWNDFHAGHTARANEIFARLTPILKFSNQHIDVSIQFFKRVLKRRGIFATIECRGVATELDATQNVAANRLVEDVIDLAADLDRV